MRTVQGFKTAPAKVTISRIFGGDPTEREIRLTVDDERSGVTTFELSIPMEAFARALFGQGYVSCEASYTHVPQLIGATPERKTVEVVVQEFRASPETRQKIKAELEVDGWLIEMGCFDNHHSIRNNTGNGGYTVKLSLSRFTRDGKPVSLESIF